MNLSCTPAAEWGLLLLVFGCTGPVSHPLDQGANPVGTDALVADAEPTCGCGPAEHAWLLIDDDSVEGAFDTAIAGADVCGVEARCEGVRLLGVEAHLMLGEGSICDGGPEAGCSAVRIDPNAVLTGVDDACEVASSPSDYVAIGRGGRLAVRFDRPCGLLGCEVRAVSLGRSGNDDEGYRLRVCADPEGSDCLETSIGGERLVGGEMMDADCCICRAW